MPENASPQETNGRTRRDKLTLGLLTLIVLFGLLLRLWGIGWSLPDARHPLATYHPDELINLSAARAADIPHGQFDIGFYNYGAFYFYLVSFAQTFGRGWGLIPKTPETSASRLPSVLNLVQAAPEQAALFLTGRLVTALLGTATILVLFALGSRLFGRRVGLPAALFYAITPLAVLHAHFLTVDVPATFFVTLTLLWAARLRTQQTWKDYALAGTWAGLAAATKYNTGLVLIAPIVAHFLTKSPEIPAKRHLAHLGVLLGAAALVFLVACPGPWLNWNVFWNGSYPGSGVRYELFEHARTGHDVLFVDTGPGWWYHLMHSLYYGLGGPFLLICLAGFVLACIRRTPQDWILLAFFLLYYLTTSLSAVRFARYMIPLLPVLCVWAARFVLEPFPHRLIRQTLAVLAAITILFTLGFTYAYIGPMAQRDPRDRAADYLEKNAPNGASIAFAKIPWFYSPPLSPLFGAPAAPTRAKAAEQTTRFQLRIPPAEWDTSVLNPRPEYIVLSNLETVNAVSRLHLPVPMHFMSTLASARLNDQGLVFTVTPLFIRPFDRAGVGVPEDLLYTLPTVTIYQGPRPRWNHTGPDVSGQ